MVSLFEPTNELKVTKSQAYYLAAEWHDKQAALCATIEADEPRIEARIRERAGEAARHHRASAAGLRLVAIEFRRKALNEPTH